MKPMHPFALLASATLAAAALTGCTQGDTGRLSIGFSSRPTTSGGTSSLAGDSGVFSLGNDTIIVRTVEFVLREIELKPVEDVAGCQDEESEGEHEDECEEIETGPMLVTPSLDSAVAHAISVNLPAGTFDELKLKIQPPDDEAPADRQFTLDHPDFAQLSLRVTGTYSTAGARSDFTYTSDLNARQEIELDPPLMLAVDGAVNVTVRFDIGRWFLDAAHSALLNPATALQGGPNELLVRDNIRASIRAFRDDDRDGDDDDHEDDHGGDRDDDH